jgi:hypothetical protein
MGFRNCIMSFAGAFMVGSGFWIFSHFLNHVMQLKGLNPDGSMQNGLRRIDFAIPFDGIDQGRMKYKRRI